MRKCPFEKCSYHSKYHIQKCMLNIHPTFGLDGNECPEKYRMSEEEFRDSYPSHDEPLTEKEKCLLYSFIGSLSIDDVKRQGFTEKDDRTLGMIRSKMDFQTR